MPKKKQNKGGEGVDELVYEMWRKLPTETD